jgi:hypothetical protein
MCVKHVAADIGPLEDEDEALNEITMGSERTRNVDENTNLNEDMGCPMKTTHVYSQVCAECHRAWIESRYRDVGRHRVDKRESFKNENCFLWNLISNGFSADTGQVALPAAVEGMVLAEDSTKSGKMLSTTQAPDNHHKEDMNQKNYSEKETVEPTEPNEDDSEGIALETSSNGAEVLVRK